MSKHPLIEDYLRWLEPQIREQDQRPNNTYWDLLNIMFQTIFESHVEFDDNRMADGLDLRIEFCYASHIRPNALQDLGPCSFLEVLIGLSRRLSFAAGGSAPGWAWQLLTNLELQKMSDPIGERRARKIEGILDTCINRTYDPSGQGGFFPLYPHPDDDQTQVEIWYQMAAYISELHPEH